MMSIYLTIWHTDDDVMVGVIVGIVVALLAFYFGPYTGASMNPARTIGPNLASNAIEIIPIYLISTVSGAILAALICLKLRKSIQKPEAFN
jgi:aquaporin Z